MKNIAIFIIVIFASVSILFAGSQQTSSTLASTIITNARYLLNEDIEIRWEDDELLEYLNQGVMNLVARTRALETTEEVTLATTTQEYSLTVGYIDVETAMYDNTTDPPKGLTRIRPRDAGRHQLPGPPERYYLWNDKIGVDPEPTSEESGQTVTVYLSERPSTVTSTDNIPTPAHFDHLLVYYVAAQALMADKQMAKANYYMALWNTTLDRFRADFSNPDEAEEVSK